MKDDLFFPSYSEFIERTELIKRRQERLVQVRQESKKMAAALVKRSKNEAEKEFQNIEQLVLNEIWEQHSKELSAMRRIYENCILNINQEHYNKVVKESVSASKNTKMLLSNKNKRSVSPIVQNVSSIQKHNTKKNELSTEAVRPNLQQNSSALTPNKEQIFNSKNMSKSKNVQSNVIQKRNTIPGKSSKQVAPEKTAVEKDNPYNVKIISSRFYTGPAYRPKFSSRNDNFICDGLTTGTTLNFKVDDEKDIFFQSYTSRVHDRIRILEQKEKILQRRVASISEKSVLAETLDAKNIANRSNKENVAPPSCSISNSAEKISSTKSCTSTDRLNTYSIETNQQHPHPVSSLDTQFASKTLSTQNTDIQKNMQPPHVCKKRKNQCTRAELHNGEDLVIVIRNSRSVKPQENTASQQPISFTTSTNTSTESESVTSQQFTRIKNMNVTVDVSKNKKSEKYVPRVSNVEIEMSRKLPNWRKLFQNSEKLSESSYLSPPTSLIKNQVKNEKKCKNRSFKECRKKSEEFENYVVKLLLMSPESMENLNNIVDDTLSTISDEVLEVEEVALTDGSETESEQFQANVHKEEYESESLDEREFIRQMLEVNLPTKNTNTQMETNLKPSVSHPNVQSSQSEIPAAKSVVSADDPVPFLDKDIMSRIANFVNINKEPSVSSTNNGRGKENYFIEPKVHSTVKQQLSGWIGTSIRRTLEASAINSTSSNDDNCDFRHANQLMQSLIDRELESENENSFSPIRVPDVHLNIP